MCRESRNLLALCSSKIRPVENPWVVIRFGWLELLFLSLKLILLLKIYLTVCRCQRKLSINEFCYFASSIWRFRFASRESGSFLTTTTGCVVFKEAWHSTNTNWEIDSCLYGIIVWTISHETSSPYTAFEKPIFKQFEMGILFLLALSYNPSLWEAEGPGFDPACCSPSQIVFSQGILKCGRTLMCNTVYKK